MAKHIFVTGGVTSSLGKGIFAASLAKLLQASGYRVTIQKFDPYLNVDPGTLNPYEHGECYVTDDGAETDLDLGHYERFLNVRTSQANNVTTGRVYQQVIDNEREGVYLGKTVQIIPHVTDEIKRRMLLLGETGEYDIVLTELGGTVGDIESLPYIESVRQLRWQLGSQNCMVIHLTLIPYLSAAKELKTKPTQHSVKELLKDGVQPDMLVCRTEHDLSTEIKEKLALFCNVDINSVVQAKDSESIYDVPVDLLKENITKTVLTKLNLPFENPSLNNWKQFLHKLKNPSHTVNIGLIGKYVELQDAYKSILEAFIHAGAVNECKVKVHSVHSEGIDDKNAHEQLGHLDGILVAPGFGNRGIEGKIEAIKYAREQNVPFFGICLGMQCAVIEFARNVLNYPDAHSGEMEPDSGHKVIDLMEDQKAIESMGGTMRLGAYPCTVKDGTKAFEVYQNDLVHERHRHRYEFDNAYLEEYQNAGMLASGTNPDSELVEIVELKDHPWFVGVQFHPELKSTVKQPHPLFVHFIRAALAFQQKDSDASSSQKENAISYS